MRLTSRNKKQVFKKPDKKTLFVLGGVLFFIPMFIFLFWMFGIVFTYTGSIPVGFYRLIPVDRIQRGDYIAFCLPDPFAAMGLDRGYIKSGRCRNGSEALVKQVIGIPGDKIDVFSHTIRVNGLDYYAPTDVIDKRRLHVYRFIENGTRFATGYWLYGDGNAYYSWDSRYYGGIPKTNIAHRLVPLWLF